MIKIFSDFSNLFNQQVNKNSYKYEGLHHEINSHANGFVEMFNLYDGQSFGDGLYRLHKTSDFDYWNKMIGRAFPKYEHRIHCFGYDWLGRHFALDQSRLKDGMYEVLMFEPGTGEVLEIPCDFLAFHNEEIVNYHDACLASQFFDEWKVREIPPHSPMKSVLVIKFHSFLGGVDALENMELSDMDAYWEVIINVLEKVKDLPEGTNVSFDN